MAVSFEHIKLLLAQKKPDEARPYFAQAYEILAQDAGLAANEAKRLARLKELAEPGAK